MSTWAYSLYIGNIPNGNMSGKEILDGTEEIRLKTFFELLDENQEKFKDFFIDKVKYFIPMRTSCKERSYPLFMVKPPLVFLTSKKYLVKLNDYYYQLYRLRDTLSFIKIQNGFILRDSDISSFYNSYNFSYVFYLFYRILSELTDQGIKIRLMDTVFGNLTKKFNYTGEDKEDVKILLTLRPNKTIKKGENIMKLSIFS